MREVAILDLASENPTWSKGSIWSISLNFVEDKQLSEICGITISHTMSVPLGYLKNLKSCSDRVHENDNKDFVTVNISWNFPKRSIFQGSGNTPFEGVFRLLWYMPSIELF